MNNHFVAPEIKKDGFTCPHCGAFSAMRWSRLQSKNQLLNLWEAHCHKCGENSIWRTSVDPQKEQEVGRMIDPLIVSLPMPNLDLPETCKLDYLEAREISAISPRGAAALLRLCIQKLCINLGGKGKKLNDDISYLVSNGLSVQIQQALDVVRVIGNNAVHPGEISIEDKPETVQTLFGLINLIVENQISQPKQVASLFQSLPEGAKTAVAKRDKNS